MRAVSSAVGIVTCCIGLASFASEPRHLKTEVLGNFTGHAAPLHPDNSRAPAIAYYGTDLGWTYEHRGRLQFLFGDTLLISGETIDPLHDDVFGNLDLAEWPTGRDITTKRIPPLALMRRDGSATLAGLNPKHTMEGLKTPVGGVSDGTHEYAVFITGKPALCESDADCTNGLTCDTTLGFVGTPAQEQQGLTFACARSWPGCKPASGFCSDRTSTLWSDSEYGRVSGVGMKHIFGVRAGENAARYAHTKTWLTNKFINVAMRSAPDGREIYLWGRPHFIGVNAKRATLGMYFAKVLMPSAPAFEWKVRYFAGTDNSGGPIFSGHESHAVPVDLDASLPGVQSTEVHDIVQHMSIVWLPPLQRWVMLYGGGVSKHPIPSIAPTCGVLEVFVRNQCDAVALGNGAVRMRTASVPWGPWSAPTDVFVGGNPDARPVADQYAAGGVLYHPACAGSRCETRSTHLPKDDYGWLYGANIIEPWTTATPDGVEIVWNASTWDPYRVILLKTSIAR